MIRLLLLLACLPMVGWAAPIGGDDAVMMATQEPQLLSKVMLGHPNPASQKKLTLTLRVRIDAEGKVQQAVLQNSSGVPAFDQRLEAAARHWQFTPGLRHGKPVAMIVNLPVTFMP